MKGECECVFELECVEVKYVGKVFVLCGVFVMVVLWFGWWGRIVLCLWRFDVGVVVFFWMWFEIVCVKGYVLKDVVMV